MVVVVINIDIIAITIFFYRKDPYTSDWLVPGLEEESSSSSSVSHGDDDDGNGDDDSRRRHHNNNPEMLQKEQVVALPPLPSYDDNDDCSPSITDCRFLITRPPSHSLLILFVLGTPRSRSCACHRVPLYLQVFSSKHFQPSCSVLSPWRKKRRQQRRQR